MTQNPKQHKAQGKYEMSIQLYLSFCDEIITIKHDVYEKSCSSFVILGSKYSTSGENEITTNSEIILL